MDPDRLRFPFGRNWASFLEVLDETRIREAERSLEEMLGRERISGATFLDVGSGSGLFSLAAMRLGAARVHSFDLDADSVECTREVKRRYCPDAALWTVEQASVLDTDFMCRLGQWDVVYAWGVLHHTGHMWRALDHVIHSVDRSGVLFVAIYNEQGMRSRFWRSVKRFYNTGWLGHAAVRSVFVPWFVARGFAVDLLRGRSPRARYRDYRRMRGMSAVHDWNDWLGGYPFEVARPDEVISYCQGRGFSQVKLVTREGSGCNEYVMARSASTS